MRSSVSWLVTPRSFILIVFFLAQNILASPNSLTFQAKIVKPNQENLEEPSVYFKFKYTDAIGTCVVYEEEFAGVVMTGTKGLISMELGAGVKTFPPAAVNLYDVFNFGTALSCQGGTPTATVTPTAIERRKVIVQFNDGSGMQTLPIMNLNSVPFALHATLANNSNQLAGVNANQYTKFTDIAAAGCTAGQALRYTGLAFVCENIPGASVTTVTATAPVLSSGGATPNISLPKATSSASGYLGSADWTVFNNKLSNFSTLTSGDLTTAFGFTPLQSSSSLSGDVTGTISATVVANVGGVSAANVATGTNLANNSTSANTASTIVRRNASGDFTASVVNATTFSGTNTSSINVSTQNVYLYDNVNTNRILFRAPTSGITNYTLTLPAAVGTNGQVLSTNASGDLAWANASAAGSVGTVTATAPLVSSGGASPDISLAKSTATADGYLASSDWSIFNSKLSNFSTMTSLDVTTALTFIPLNRASNLSDLANATTARSNLGLGTAAVLNGASSGDATATELVKGNDTRLSDARAPTGAASGDLTGTYPNPTLTTTGVVASTDYTKVTVDAKGRVTSAGRLVSGDITTLYGYTPANNNAAWDLNVSGDVSRATGNVGIGMAAPGTSLDVSGAITSRPYGTAAGQTGQLILRELASNGTNSVIIKAADNISGDISFTLPSSDGTSGQVLSTNGSGDLSWATASSGSVTSVTASAPLASSGGATPNVTLTRSSATEDGYLASTDWTIFNNKLGTATTFSGDVTGTYDATVLANSGVTAGSFSNVTVDAKGRVTAGVASLDITTSVSGVLPIANGGTNASSFANTYGVNYFDGTRLVTSPAGAANQMLVQTVAGPIWTTATYPSVTTVNQLLYSSANNTVAGLATAADSILTTNSSGDPSWSAITADTYTQYALLAGRSGGQTLNGGTLSSQDLTLDSTVHATKGNVIMNPTGGNVGIGTTAPAVKMEVSGEIKIGETGISCSTTTKGSIRYNNTFSVLEFCNGTGWNLIQAAACSDATPTSFVFSDQSNQTTTTQITSDIVQVSGLNCTVPVTVSGVGSPQIQICSDAGCGTVVQGWTSSPSSIVSGQYLQLRQTSDAAGGATTQATVISGGTASIWSVSTAGGDCVGTTPPVGTVCADETIYAGLSPDTGVKMFTTRCDYGQTWNGSACIGTRLAQNWNNGTVNWTTTGYSNSNTGKANSAGLFASADAGSPYASATICENLNQEGHTDWYLPALNELNILYVGNTAIQNFDTGGSKYWSATEYNDYWAWNERFSDGLQDSANWGTGVKTYSYLVRCVRR